MIKEGAKKSLIKVNAVLFCDAEKFNDSLFTVVSGDSRGESDLKVIERDEGVGAGLEHFYSQCT